MLILILKMLSVAGAVALGDICWAKYFIHVKDLNPTKSAIWASFIMLCSMISVASYVDDKRMMPAALIGAYLGTFFTIKKEKHKDQMTKKKPESIY